MEKKRVYITNPEEIQTVKASTEEQETTFNILRAEDTILIYTSDNTMLTKLKKQLKNNPTEWTCWEASRWADGSVSGYFFRAPKRVISIRGKKKARVISEQARQKAAERLRNRNSKNSVT